MARHPRAPDSVARRPVPHRPVPHRPVPHRPVPHRPVPCRPVRRRPGRRCVALVALVALLAVVTVAGPVGVPGAVAEPRWAAAAEGRSAITWQPCGAGFECGTLAVPVDHDGADRADGAVLDLAVARRRARQPARRLGVLLFNPGGPGVSGLAHLRSSVESLPAPLRDRFDLVAFDPRGVGKSEPVECGIDIDPLFDESFSPATASERDELVAAFQRVAEACARGSELLPYVSTFDTARDLEILRRALRERRLNFVGFSYGTYLGAVYASLYPHRVRAFVFDGPVDPSADATELALAQAQGFDRALDAFLADCAAHRGCAFHHGGDPETAYDALRARAMRSPLPTARLDGRTVNGTRFDAAVVQLLYLGRLGWRSLAEALAEAERGNAATLLAHADAFVGREADGRRHQMLDAFWAVTCLDGPVPGDVDAAARLEARAAEVAPRLGAFVVNFSLACAVWPRTRVPPPVALTATGAPPILVVATRDDPATPIAGARALDRALDRAALLVVAGERHTAFGGGNRCVDAIVTAYLVDRAIPARGARC